MSDPWSLLTDALDAIGGAPANFWLRDDDAVSDTPELRRLAGWAARNGTEALLAVIPARVEETLSQALVACPELRACVHGWAHTNHACAPDKKQEFAAHRPMADMRTELRDGLEIVRQLSPDTALGVFVPPWNRVCPEVVSELAEMGFSGLSVFADRFLAGAPEGLKIGNTHLDVIDWHGTRGCRPHPELIEEAAELVRAHAGTGIPIGILTHHLVHDEAVWEFLERLGELVRSHPRARWVGPAEVFPSQPPAVQN
ncbi:MAG: polysaccharide deacetylase family protein [Pseudomonadota bacterium]